MHFLREQREVFTSQDQGEQFRWGLTSSLPLCYCDSYQKTNKDRQQEGSRRHLIESDRLILSYVK